MAANKAKQAHICKLERGVLTAILQGFVPQKK
jgi:hypothetical protein